MPNTCDGSSLWKGNRKPVTLVSTVVTRNTAVSTGKRLPPSMPSATTRPATIPIRLNTTCKVVKADSDNPSIMSSIPLVARLRHRDAASRDDYLMGATTARR